MKRSLSKMSALAAAAVLLGSAAVHAAPLVDFKPVPTSPTTPEFQFAVNTTPGVGDFQNDAGTLSNNNLALPAGLLIETPFNIAAAIPGKTVTATGSTQFADASFVLSSEAIGPASNMVIPGTGGASFLVQAMDGGTFSIYASGAIDTAVLLLQGTFSNAAIGGALGGQTAFFTANSVTFTGGAIYDALLAAGGNGAGGSLSISMNDLTTDGIAPTTLGLADGGANIAPFKANATGLISTPVIPEPASMAGLTMAAAGLLARRRRA